MVVEDEPGAPRLDVGDDRGDDDGGTREPAPGAGRRLHYFLLRAFLRACRSRLRFLLRASRSAALSVEMGSGA